MIYLQQKRRQCVYSKCVTEEVGHKRVYVSKFFILFIAYCYLIRSVQEFTFITLSLYVVPMFIDNTAALLKAFNVRGILFIDTLIKVMNLAILIMCSLGMVGFFTDTATSFVVSSDAVLFGGASISKSLISMLLLVNILEVLFLIIYVPSKTDSIALKVVEHVAEAQAEGGQS